MSEHRRPTTDAPAPAPAPGFIAAQLAFAGHIRDPEHRPAPADIEDRRMAIYRDLFFNNISGLLQTAFPVLYKILGDECWQGLVRDFLVRHRCSTPLFPELAQELLDYLAHEREAHADDPPFMLELAHYEWVELAVGTSEDEADDTLADPAGDLLTGVPLVSPVAWQLSYRYPVHRIGPEYQPSEPDGEPTHLIVYRNRSDGVEFMQINAVTQRLLQLLEAHPDRTGASALQTIAAELAHPDPEKVLAAGQALLEDLRARDIILGSRR
ncbi:MAG: putative DNA-binding domain-containing protein [Thiohalocapsa sp.]|nr:putative DNA-binding domain-containing protein [Thiohalocapsa sp.]MCF7991463.1 putative DNA-binding domain-containing protein [Thiohalocapsa sp.]